MVLAADGIRYNLARNELQKLQADAQVGVGENTNFTELNRKSPAANVSYVAFGLNPQVHAVDNAAIVESLEIQDDTVHTARTFV